MNLSKLKPVRVILSLLFFLGITFIFLDFANYATTLIADWLTYLQFIPSFIKFVNLVSVAAFGFLFVLLLTLLFGRVYCSSICPLGTFQDIVSYLKKKIQKKKRYKYDYLPESKYLRYSLLVFSILFILGGSLFLVNMLDPFTNYGRFASNLFRPILLAANNILAYSLEKFDIYTIYPVEIKGFYIESLIYPLLFMSLVIWLSLKQGRLFCNTVCPVGTLLGLISKKSLFKIKFDEITCKGCGVCEKVCKSGCIDTDNKEIDFSRCVCCFNCFDVCPTLGLNYHPAFKAKPLPLVEPADMNKRNFLLAVGTYMLGLSQVIAQKKEIIVKVKSTVPIKQIYPVSPPGSGSISHFTDNCTACHLCVSACPTHVLQPSFLEYGFLGMLQPRLDNSAGFCNYECKICTDVCPTGALLPVTLEKKKLIQLGKAVFIKENCIVETQKTECGACSEHCPTKAVYMVPYENLRLPELNNELCIGCGACEHACPTIPYKSIYIEGNPLHLTASKPEEKPIQEMETEEEFPF